jgi:hypothetical protein
MCGKRPIWFVGLALWLGAGGPALRAQSACNNTPAYSACELTFELSEQDAAAHTNLYTSVELRAEFRSPTEHTFVLPAYWDGGRKMVIRVAPTEAGVWNYRLTSNIAAWEGQTGSFTAAASGAPGFVRAANVHHWAYTERNLPHLWMGATELGFGREDDAAFRAMADARAAEKFNHVRGLVLDEGTDVGFSSPDQPDLAHFRRLDERIRYLNQKGIVADLILAGGDSQLTKLFRTPEQRRRFVRYVAARYSAFNVTWQGVQFFEDYPDPRALLKEIGSVLKDSDGYQHPRTSGAHVTSAPLLDDGWMNFVAYGTPDDAAGAIEHQLYAVPFVNLNFAASPGDLEPAAFRRRLWNATMDGEYVSGDAGSPPNAKAMTVWFDILSQTRHWELEPYFDADGGRAVALPDAEYLVYIEKPGALELTVEKHSYDVLWINPADGEVTRKKFSGDHFTGEPPDQSHDWVLHVVREGHLESMNKSYRFESRDILMQQIEVLPEKVPFEIDQPTGDLTVGKPAPYGAKIKRQTRGTRSMMWLWTGEVPAQGQGYRVLATGESGTLTPPSGLANNYPAVLNLRLYGMNANGKVYELDRALGLNR